MSNIQIHINNIRITTITKSIIHFGLVNVLDAYNEQRTTYKRTCIACVNVIVYLFSQIFYAVMGRLLNHFNLYTAIVILTHR